MTAQQLVNDTNSAGTQIIETTPSGEVSSSVTLNNSGTLILGNSTHTGSISSDNGKFTTDGFGNVNAQGLVANGNIIVNGATVLNGTLSGSIHLINSGTTTVNPSSSVVITHGLGGTPGWIGFFTTNANINCTWISNITSTTFTINNTNGTVTGNYLWMAIK